MGGGGRRKLGEESDGVGGVVRRGAWGGRGGGWRGIESRGGGLVGVNVAVGEGKRGEGRVVWRRRWGGGVAPRRREAVGRREGYSGGWGNTSRPEMGTGDWPPDSANIVERLTKRGEKRGRQLNWVGGESMSQAWTRIQISGRKM